MGSLVTEGGVRTAEGSPERFIAHYNFPHPRLGDVNEWNQDLQAIRDAFSLTGDNQLADTSFAVRETTDARRRYGIVIDVSAAGQPQWQTAEFALRNVRMLRSKMPSSTRNTPTGQESLVSALQQALAQRAAGRVA